MFSFKDVPCRTMLFELFGKAHTFRGQIEQMLVEETRSADLGVSATAGDDAALDSLITSANQ